MTLYQSGGLSSAEDIEIFQAWHKELPTNPWSRAEVDQYGLTLHDSDGTTSLHFPNAICGFSGTGPQATVVILEEAGFGDKDELSKIVFVRTRASFTKQ